MTLYSLLRRNMVGNAKHYLLYFASMILSVVIFYTFTSLQFSPEIQASIKSSTGVLSIFTQASIILILFVSIFIWYSNAFFIKRRKKEIGLYSLLGMRKRTIGRMLFYENMLMGVIATVIGILIGTLMSKLSTLMFLKLLQSTMAVSFILPWKAVAMTFLVFMVISFLTSVQARRLIYRFKLIDLFLSEKEGESLPRTSAISAVASIILLGFAYWLTFQPMDTTAAFLRNFGLISLGLIIGTYLLFRYAVLFLLKLFKNRSSFYYRGINLVGLSQLMYRINSNVRIFTMIALLIAVTISAVAVGLSSYYSIAQSSRQDAPFSYILMSKGSGFDEAARSIISEDAQHPVTAAVELDVIKANADIGSLPVTPSGYGSDEVPVKLVSASAFNAAQIALNREERANLTDHEAALIQPLYTELSTADVNGGQVAIPLREGELNVRISSLFTERIMGWSFPDVMIVLSDSAFKEAAAQLNPVHYSAYVVENQGNAEETNSKLNELEGIEQAEFSSYYLSYRNNLEVGSMNIFVLGFLGLIFLAATGSMIYFKQLTEARADKQRYVILRKIGVSRKEILAVIAKQTMFVFALPLVIGVLHSTVILKAITSINLIHGDLTAPIALTMILYAVIYMLYFLLCVSTYNKIVNRI